MCTDSGNNIRYWSPPLVPFDQSQIYMVGKKHSGEANQMTLASEGSEYGQLFSVAINWVDKMNLSLYANM